jgi:hypothetical protein
MRLAVVPVVVIATALAFGQIASAEQTPKKSAKKPVCSIKAPEGADDATLRKMAKITREDAFTRAKAHFAPAKPMSPGMNPDPQVEEGCLVWFFNITFDFAPKKPQYKVFNIYVDAGNGQILSTVEQDSEWLNK